jgi:hypothetical protein
MTYAKIQPCLTPRDEVYAAFRAANYQPRYAALHAGYGADSAYRAELNEASLMVQAQIGAYRDCFEGHRTPAQPDYPHGRPKPAAHAPARSRQPRGPRQLRSP